jgi:ribonucleoside-diphosphate reductase alpha chain
MDMEKLKRTIGTAMRMLDNVIELNFYSVGKARNSNFKHRPVGLGIMGFQDCLHMLRVPYGSSAAVEFADRSMEEIAYTAYWASTDLAEERGPYSTFKGSLWDRGILPLDTVKLLHDERGGYVECDTSAALDWEALRRRVKQVGMRNSNCLAIAPTATIASIAGCCECIEPQVSNVFKRETLSGEFLQVNSYLVAELKRHGLWTPAVRDQLKRADGSVQGIAGLPEESRLLFRTAWELPQRALIDLAAARGPYVDQSQSVNLFAAAPTIGKLSSMYRYAWTSGLKTTYYLRSRPATRIQQATVCSIENPENCEACQ